MCVCVCFCSLLFASLLCTPLYALFCSALCACACAQTPMQEGLRKVSHNKAYIILMVAFGIGVGMFSAITTLLGQIVNAQGYSDVMRLGRWEGEKRYKCGDGMRRFFRCPLISFLLSLSYSCCLPFLPSPFSVFSIPCTSTLGRCGCIWSHHDRVGPGGCDHLQSRCRSHQTLY